MNSCVEIQGSRRWFNANKILHRIGGPARVDSDGYQEWYVNGRCHRIDGPSVIYSDGRQSWYVSGHKCYSNKQFQKAANLSDEEMTVLILKYGNVK